jgi:hypothetical protein
VFQKLLPNMLRFARKTSGRTEASTANTRDDQPTGPRRPAKLATQHLKYFVLAE